MNRKQEIELIKLQLDEVEDEKLLSIIRDILAYGKMKSTQRKPFTMEEYIERYDESVKAVEAGNLIAHEEVIEYFKKKKEQ